MKQLDEQRYLWLLRAFIIFLIISIFLNLILFISFDKISPAPKKEVFFVTGETQDFKNLYISSVNTNNNLQISQNSQGYEIAKAYISNYVTDRESVFSNIEKMQSLWGIESYIYMFSSEDVYTSFLKSKEYVDGFINKDKEITTVKIKNIEYQNKMNVWDVSVVLEKTDLKGKLLKTETKDISIKSRFLSGNLIKNEKTKWENPLSFQITEYKYK